VERLPRPFLRPKVYLRRWYVPGRGHWVVNFVGHATGMFDSLFSYPGLPTPLTITRTLRCACAELNNMPIAFHPRTATVSAGRKVGGQQGEPTLVEYAFILILFLNSTFRDKWLRPRTFRIPLSERGGERSHQIRIVGGLNCTKTQTGWEAAKRATPPLALQAPQRRADIQSYVTSLTPQSMIPQGQGHCYLAWVHLGPPLAFTALPLRRNRCGKGGRQ